MFEDKSLELKKLAKSDAWKPSDLKWLLHSTQRSIRGQLRLSKGRRFVVNCSRRLGKSYLCCVLAIEHALSKPKSQIRYAAPTMRMVRSIIAPHMRMICEYIPEKHRPTWSKIEGVWSFPNGSEITVAGCDAGNSERLRGTSTDLGIIDEAGFIDDLEYVIQSVLLPQTITTGGRLVLVSTPPRSPAHPFTDYCREAEETGNYVHKTIYDAPHITHDQIEEYIRECGGEKSTNWKREFLAQFVVDETLAVVPEFTTEEEFLVGEWERPEYFDAYVAMDLGFHDLTVGAFAYLDFLNDKLVVENEVVCQHSTSTAIDTATRFIEEQTWGSKQPYLRVVDAQPMVIAEMLQSGRSWAQARNDDPEASINALRVAFANHKIIIHPRCKTIIAHLRHAIWNHNRTSFARVKRHSDAGSDFAGYGHFDGVSAMVYLNRHVIRGKNPYPRYMHGENPRTHWLRPGGNGSLAPDAQAIRQMFHPPRRRG